MEIYQVKTKHKVFVQYQVYHNAPIKPPTDPPILSHNSFYKSIAYDFSNFCIPTKKYKNYVNFWVNSVNDNYISSKVWKQTNKQIN